MDFFLQGLKVRVEAEGEAALRSAAILEHLGARRGAVGTPDLTLSWTKGALPAAAGREVGSHLDARAVRDDSGVLHLSSPTVTCAIAANGVARGVIAPGAELPLYFLTWVLVHQLRALGWYTLHAGAIARPGTEDPRVGCVVVGESGAGKSTLTLSMVREGWGLLSDDSVLLHRSGEGLGAYALRRGVYLEPAAAERTFPTLTGRWHEVPLVEAVKHGLESDQLAGSQVERCVPAVVLFPAIGGGDTSRLEPLSASEVLFGLVQQSRLAELDSDGAATHMQLLAAVAGATRGYRLVSGRDVFEAPARVSSLLAEAAR